MSVGLGMGCQIKYLNAFVNHFLPPPPRRVLKYSDPSEFADSGQQAVQVQASTTAT